MVSKAIQLLQSAKRSGVHILMNKDQLQVKISKGVQIDPKLLEEIKNNKDLLIDFLKDDKLKSKKVNSYEKELLNIYRDSNDLIPLSFSQKRLWFIDQLEGSVQYHISAVLRLNGKLNKGALTYALQNIVNRHEILRTVIHEHGGQGWQYIKEKDSWQLSAINYTKDQEEAGELKSYIKKTISQPFNLSEDYMLRVNLITLEEQEHVLVITMHHIASDGWSRSILVKELVELYKAYEEGRNTNLLPLAIQYADYAIWQRRYMQGEVLEEKMDYWKEKLKGIEPLHLPVDCARPSVQSTNGATAGFLINKQVSKDLQLLSQQQGVTLFMTLLTVFKILLYRYSSQNNICVGTPIAGRQQDELEGLIGFFVNTLVLRSEINGNALFTELLQQVKATTLEAYENQEITFEKVVEVVVKERDQSRSPLFQVMFILQNTPEVPQLHLGELTLSREGYENTTSQFDITFTITETSHGLQGSVQYCTDLFSKETILGMINHFRQLVQSVAEVPEQQIGLLPMLSNLEQQQLLVDFNNTSAPYPKDKTIIDLFEEQAALTPDAVAVVFEQEQLTYKELNERSNRIAHYLKRKGIRQEMLVPVCIERSLEMIIGILGIIKAGGAYVPLDPDYPAERISYMLADSGASIVISSKASRLKLPVSDNIDIIEIDGDREAIDKQSVYNVQAAVKPHHLVYVIYTSGSTGKPKGVMNEHKGVVNRLKWAQNYYKITSGEIILQKTTFSFDVSVWELLLPLISGARLVFAKPEGHRDNEYLQSIIESQKITMLHFVPSMLETFLLDLNIDKSKGLKKVLCSGEALKLAQVELFREKLPDVELHNLYGPTEAAIDVTSWSLSDKEKDIKGIPIGKPVWNTSIYILDEFKGLVPVGVTGEIYIGGVQVARGYLNLEGLTAEKFIADPFSKAEGARLYKTGDIGRWLSDGNIEYTGRKDEQVKIRGYRIELGEIENVVMQSGLVSQAVVVVREDKEGNKRLAGCVVPEEGFDTEVLIMYLRGKLPQYMVPVLWVKLEELPLTVNGKIDRKSLPEADGVELSKEYEAPCNEIEEKLAAIWQELLQVDRVGVHDNFFKAGGHSLLAMRLISAIRNAMEVEVVIKNLFIFPTIRELGLYLKGQVKGSALPSIGVQERPELVPLSFSQERLWFIDQLEGSVQYHIPSILRLKGRLDVAALSKALQAIVNRHEVLRTVILQREGEPYQYVKEKEGWGLGMLDGSEYVGDTRGLQQCVHELINKPFDLSNDYLLRADLIGMEEGDQVLVVTFHHIVSDGWSTSVFVRELVELYGAKVSGGEPVLSVLPVQYADYSIWQRKYLQGEVWERKMGYWKGKLEGVSALQLPTDFRRPVVQSTRGSVERFSIDKEVSEGLQALSRQEGTTLFMTLLSVLKVLLYRYSGQVDICVGSAIAGRQYQELEGLIGFFVNTLALRDTVEGDASFGKLLKKVKGSTLEAYEHQEVPFERVVEAVVKERDLSRSPLFQVMFVLQNTPDIPRLELGEVELSREVFVQSTSKFDLSFNLTETGGGLKGSVQYCTDLYSKETIERMIEHFVQLIGCVIEEPHEMIGSFRMLGKKEEHQLLEEFNDIKTTYPGDRTIIDLFEQQVKKTPEATAVVFEQEQLTYLELNERSNLLAHYLRDRGVKEETLVPICIERGIEMLVGIMGILKAGGAYVPIDSEYPEERIKYMLEDTSATIVISSKESKLRLENTTGLDIIEIDSNWLKINKQAQNNLDINIKPDQLAYVIYTSGSTGRPKGVMVEHGNVVSLVKGIDYISLDQWDVLLSTGSSSFDATTFEYWGMLLNGGQLILCSENRLLDSELLKEEIRRRRVNKMWFTSSWFNQLVDLDNGIFEGLKTIIVGGEKLSEQHISKVRQRYVDIEIINGYGPTENTTFSLTYKITDTKISNSIPIGRPLNNRKAYVLDETAQLSPIGVMGEIFLAGAGLSRGYLNQPELTHEKFIENLFTDEGTRMYKTGDLGRWLSDGNIEYMGRKDDQVKIRGYRIEPGEIENVAMQSGLVKQAVVMATEGKEGGRRLTGYIIVNESYDKTAFTEYLKSKLPDYMIPVLWIEVTGFVLTHNGKIDKKVLPDANENNQVSNEYEAPKNDFETKLVEVWQQLLGVDKVGVNDNFFELGGDSILTIQVVSRVRKSGYELQPKDLFFHQTVRKLSRVIVERSGIIVKGEQGVLTGLSGLIPIQQWYLEKEPLEISHFNQSVLLRIDKSVTGSMLIQVVQRLITFHDTLQFKYYKKDGEWNQEYSTVKDVVIIEDLRSVSAPLLSSTITKYANTYQQSLNISKGELMKVVLMQTSETEVCNRLLIIIHHLVVDGVSWRILLEDMEMLLTGPGIKDKLSTVNKSSSYRQWYNALEKYGKSSRLLSQKGYWERVSKNYSPLRVDKQHDGQQRLKDAGHFTMRLNAEQTQLLLQEIPRVYHTEINDILLCGLATALCEWNKTDKVVIGLEGHGREEIEEGIDISRTVGWFTVLYPVLLEVDRKMTADELIKGVKEQLRQIPDKGLGYGVLKYINKEDALAGNECWDIVFNYLGQLGNVVNNGGCLTASGESGGAGISGDYVVNEKLSINSVVRSGELVLNWSYSLLHYHEESIKELAELYLSKLKVLINHCIEQQNVRGVVYTPSDYGLGLEVTYKELDIFLNEDFESKTRKDHIEGLYRLSGLQQGMLFHGLYNESGAYIEQLFCDFIGLNVEIFSSSWQYVIKRHSILRSAFYYDAFSLPVQCVFRQIELPLKILDYRSMSDEQQLEAVKQYKESDKEKAFDFKVAPLMRVSLIRLGEDRYKMLWTFHHILFDGWSLSIIMEEFLSTYKMLISGNEAKAAEEDRYEDYIRYIERVDKNQEEMYWSNYLNGVYQSTTLPFINKTTELTKGVGLYKSLLLQLNEKVTGKIQNFIQRLHLTMNTVMQGVWSLLLHHYTGNDSVVFGVVVSGRPDELLRIEHRVGLYINTLPLHSQIKDWQEIAFWLHEIQREQVLSRQYQYTPLHTIQRWTGVQGDLFDSILVFENYPVSKVVSSQQWGLRVEKMNVSENNNYPISIVIGSSEQISIQFNYNSTLLSELYVKEIKDHFENVLLQLIDNTEGKLSDIKILTLKEEYRLLDEFNESTETHSKYFENKTIVDSFQEQVFKNPNKISVVFKEDKLTFTKINERSNQLARYLGHKGVKQEALIPFCIGSSLEMVIVILGILKSGCAYVPVDPQYPEERIKYMLEDTAAEIIICLSGNKPKIPIIPGLDIIELDKEWADIMQQPKDNLAINIQPDNLAYVIYTSGSTGKPKGVLVEHRNVVSLVKNVDYVTIHNEDILLSTGSPSFDATTFEYWSMLLNGGQLNLCTENKLLDSQLLKEEISTRNVNIMWFTSSWFNQLVDFDITVFEGLKTILVGGEKLSEPHIRKIRREYSDIKIINGYGPTENTTFSLTYNIIETDIASIPVGRPLNNRKAFITDKTNQLVPIGVLGEICVAGAGLARGYLNNPELTLEKFVKNPFDVREDARMYRTGDLGRWLPDGNIEYLGRKDDQVKIRGFRIEPGEIENVILQSGLVNQVVVMAREAKEGNKQLVGYVVTNELFEHDTILSYLKSKLPEYMVPSFLIELKAFPLTLNGKIDKALLPDPNTAVPVNIKNAEPRNELERTISEIWQEVLELEHVSIYDDFFELGGHSLMAIRLISDIRRKLKVELTIEDLFTHLTIAELANYLQQKSKQLIKQKNDYKYLIPVKTEGNKTPLYIVCGGGGTVMKFNKFINLFDSDQPVYVLQEPAEIADIYDIPENIENVASKYIEEILTQNPKGPYAFSGHCSGGIVAYEMAKQIESTGKKVNLLAMFDTVAPLKKKRQSGSVKNLYNVPKFIKKSVLKVYFKIYFEMFLLRKHTKHAVNYKINSLKFLINKLHKNEKVENEFEIYKKLSDWFGTAHLNYEVTPYDRDIVVFYAKDHYKFLDKDKNISYKKYDLNSDIKNRWSKYVKTAAIYDIEGEHSTMFEPLYGGKEMAKLLQEHLTKASE